MPRDARDVVLAAALSRFTRGVRREEFRRMSGIVLLERAELTRHA